MKRKICVLGLDCAAPEIIFNDKSLKNIQRLMSQGTWGRLESVIPPITVPAWMCMVTSQDPGSLGVYGFRNRTDYSYSGLGFVTSNSIKAPAIWDALVREGKKSIIARSTASASAVSSRPTPSRASSLIPPASKPRSPSSLANIPPT